ncbi:MAG: hypothetical protein KGL02_06545 [Acidobacteriota bacterium]|nr:hypothetical protein [Acidobacteriota bacterium]MDE3170390.1 hypothetical protein [Acidobacteriota bacterium]
MSATRTSRRVSRRLARKPVARRTVKPAAKTAGKSTARPAPKLAAKAVSRLAPPPQVMYRLCKAGWAVIVEKIPNAQGTRFVCPFCPLSHRVPGPVRGFRKMRRAQWVKLRRVEE